jgi:hypothetical protein
MLIFLGRSSAKLLRDMIFPKLVHERYEVRMDRPAFRSELLKVFFADDFGFLAVVERDDMQLPTGPRLHCDGVLRPQEDERLSCRLRSNGVSE